MAYARLAVFPGGTEDQHRAVAEALGDAQVNAPGRLVFAAGPTPEGWQLIQVWESREQLEHWVEANLGAAFAKAGGRGYKSAPRITDFTLTDLQIDPAE